MKQATVKKADLIAKIQANRDNHKTVFDAAVVVYQTRLEEHLTRMLDAVRKGHKVSHQISLPVPEDHTKDYDRVLEMLSMEVEDEVMIDATEFAMYVMDDWNWREQFTRSTASYLVP